MASDQVASFNTELDIQSSNFNIPGASQTYGTYLTAGGIVAPPGVLQISGFAYDDEQEDTVDLSNEITDHWLENMTAVQDQIGVRPVTVTLKGRVSELVFSAATSTSILGALAAVENTLTQVPAYIGTYTPGVEQTLLTAITQAQNISVQIEQAAARLQQLASFFPASGPQRNKQQTAFAMLSALRNARVLFTVYTPFQVFYNMAIEHISASQPAGTQTVSNFSVSMKQLQITNAISEASFQAQYGGRAVTGYQPPTANGITAGVTSVTSAITSVFSTNNGGG
jgi:hypothetical protein